jgi:hypothetical protein
MPVTRGPTARTARGGRPRVAGLGRSAVAARADQDRGAVATIVVLLLASGVLLGFLALVVDVGQIYVERGELQSGADAAALAVARACATDNGQCDSRGDLVDLARRYAGANASDGVSRVARVCGRVPGVLRFGCPAPHGNRTDCLGSRPGSGSYVEVQLTTQLPGGRFALPPAFAQAVSDDFDGTSVGACARVRWARAADSLVLAMTVSTCELADAGIDEYVIHMAGPAVHGACRTRPGLPWQRPGPAGWLDAGGGQCLVDLPNSGVAAGDDTPAQGCRTRLATLRSAGTQVWLPVHDARLNRGRTDADFRHVGVVRFLVTGYVLGTGPTGSRRSTITGDPPCDRDEGERCVSGVVVGPLLPLSTLAGDANITLAG